MTDARLAHLIECASGFAAPLTQPFRGVNERRGLLFHGPSGWGEWAPFEEYSDQVAALWLAAAVEAAFGTWPTPVREAIPVNSIVPAVDAWTAAAMTYRGLKRDGCTTVKVKIAEPGQQLSDDIARVAAVRSALDDAGVDGKIRVDANGAWSVDRAADWLPLIDRAAGGLEYVEQPCATLEELAELRDECYLPIAADESIRNAADPIRAAASGAVDVVVVKVPTLGGVALGKRIAEAANVPVVVSGAMDTSVGLAAGVALAACLPHLPYACGLGTGALLAEDVVERTVQPRNGQLPVERHAPDPELLTAAERRLGREAHAWWIARLERAWHAGAAELVGSLVPG